MTDLNKLSPEALSAAMRGGTEDWGTWGSVDKHVRYAHEYDRSDRRRRMCRCGCRKRNTHAGMVNGVALMGGCELSVRRWVRDPRAHYARIVGGERGTPSPETQDVGSVSPKSPQD